jgi:hypothetical protein
MSIVLALDILREAKAGGLIDTPDVGFVNRVLRQDEPLSELQVHHLNRILRLAQKRKQDRDEGIDRPLLARARDISRRADDLIVESYAHRLLVLLDPANDDQRVEILAAFFRALNGGDVEDALLMARLWATDGDGGDPNDWPPDDDDADGDDPDGDDPDGDDPDGDDPDDDVGSRQVASP